MGHTAGIQRQRIKLHDSQLAVDAIKGVGWYARCACGWEAQRPFRDRDAARRAAEEHRAAYRSCGV